MVKITVTTEMSVTAFISVVLIAATAGALFPGNQKRTRPNRLTWCRRAAFAEPIRTAAAIEQSAKELCFAS